MKLPRLTFGIASAPMLTTPLSTSGAGKAIWIGRPESRVRRSTPFWRIWPTANEVSSSATSGAPRSGR